MVFSLTIVTLNVRGLANPNQRRWFFYLLRTLSAHVICLQEVHATPELASFWTQEWGGAASWNYHTAILLSPSLGNATFADHYDGRVLASTFRYQGRSFTITNIYAPASRTARYTFFDALSSQPSHFSSSDFLVGDWNAYPDPLLDRSSTSSPSTHRTWPHLQPFLSSFFDAALCGASERFFTFHHASMNMHARLDHVFANCRHADFTMDTRIVPCTRSDHDALVVTFSRPLSFSTPFFWRFNTSLLSSSELQTSTLSRLSPFRTNLSWDATKVIVTSLARDFAAAFARRRRSQVSTLERRLAQAQHRAANNPHNVLARAAAASLRLELDGLVTQAASRAVLRARVRWLEEGETCSSYFFRRFCSRNQSSSLTRLRDDNGAPFASDSDRHTHIWSYFRDLCSAPSFSSSTISSFLSSVSLPHLSPSHLSLLLSPFLLTN